MCKHVHYLHDLKDLEEAVTNLKAHQDDLEDTKARLCGVETWLQGQSTLIKCVEEYRHGRAKRRHCVRTWHACAWWRICLCISAPSLGF